MITPGDISDELIEKAEAECDYNVGAWDCADPKEIAAAILNAAIEAGLVSPPCCAGRVNTFSGYSGKLVMDDDGSPILWHPKSRPLNVTLEPYRGQTE